MKKTDKKILIVTDKFEPYSETHKKSLCKNMANCFVKSGYEVFVIMLVDCGISQKGLPLARRISPIKTSCAEFTRYDTRTPSGIDVYLLEPLESGVSRGVFSEAVKALMLVLEKKADYAIVWDSCVSSEIFDEISAIAVAEDEKRFSAEETYYNTALALGFEPLQNRSDDARLALQKLAQEGKLLVFSSFSEYEKRDIDKASSKFSLQMAFGLPVRDVPVFFMDEKDLSENLDDISDLLKQDIQLVIGGTHDDVFRDKLFDYPDRLAFVGSVPIDKISAFFSGVNFCLKGENAPSVADLFSFGVVPIISSSCAIDNVDLSPDCTSGSVVLFGKDVGRTISGALHEAVGLYKNRAAFSALERRLPLFYSNMNDVVGICIDGFAS